MANFDFITDEKFRASLESDYQEIEAALETKAWKAVHVLAGSIIEAVLADYLLSIGYYEEQKVLNPRVQDRTINPLEMQLGGLIEACKAKAILTERRVALSTVVQGYRNLIHPGRVIRLRESVDEDGATVAKSLVEMIVREVANKRQETFGPTAVQVVKKVVQDPDAVAFIDHLLRGMSSSELERLLLHELPDTYLHNLNYARQVSSDYAGVNALAKVFRTAFERATDEINARAVSRFVSIIKQESQQIVADYEDAFFEASDLKYLPSEEALVHVSLIKQQLFSRLENWTIPADALVRWVIGLGSYIETEWEAERLARSIGQQLIADFDETDPYDANITWWQLAHEMQSNPKIYAAFVRAVDSWIARYRAETSSPEIAEWLQVANPNFPHEESRITTEQDS